MEIKIFTTGGTIDKIYFDSDLPRPEVLRVDGGAAASNVLMQIQSNVLGRPVERMQPLDATAYGAALLAAEACGVWEPWSSGKMHQTDRMFEPQWDDDRREESFRRWKEACQL